MRSYEVVIIIHPELDEPAIEGVVEKISGWITDAGGAVEKVEKWGKRQMAYSIRKQRNGCYTLLHVKMEPSFSGELDRNLRFLEPVMRYMITAVE